jgi:hypothetical protein
VLAYFDTAACPTAAPKAIHLIIEMTRRLADGFRIFAHY